MLLAASSSSQGLAVKDFLSPFIAVLALLFTVLTFWNNNWRRGRVVVDRPRSFFVGEDGARTRILLPVVLTNTGPRTLSVGALRIQAQAGDGSVGLLCIRTYEGFKPVAAHADIATNIVLKGRDATLLHCEFEVERIGWIRRGWNSMRLQVVRGSEQRWVDCGDCSVYVTDTAYGQLHGPYVPHDNSAFLPA